jgi:hypothetical protein
MLCVRGGRFVCLGRAVGGGRWEVSCVLCMV